MLRELFIDELSTVFVGLVIGDRSLRLRGVCCKVGASDFVVCVPGVAALFLLEVVSRCGNAEVGFLTVPRCAVSRAKPHGWGAVRAIDPWPTAQEVMRAYSSRGTEPLGVASFDDLLTAETAAASTMQRVATAAMEGTTSQRLIRSYFRSRAAGGSCSNTALPISHGDSRPLPAGIPLGLRDLLSNARPPLERAGVGEVDGEHEDKNFPGPFRGSPSPQPGCQSRW